MSEDTRFVLVKVYGTVTPLVAEPDKPLRPERRLVDVTIAPVGPNDAAFHPIRAGSARDLELEIREVR